MSLPRIIQAAFTDAYATGLERVAAPLTLVCTVYREQQVAQSLAPTYLGRDAARRVPSGQIPLTRSPTAGMLRAHEHSA